MKNLSKYFSIVFNVFVVLCCFSITVFANETTQDGLSATITYDKESYNSGEDINLHIKVTNSNDYNVNNVILEALLPDGLKLKNDQDISTAINKLESGEELSLDLVLVENQVPTSITEITEPSNIISTATEVTTTVATNNDNNSNDKSIVNTGSVLACLGIILLVAGLSLTVVFVVRKKKTAKKIISLILCISVSVPLIATTITNTQATEFERKSFTVTEKISVNNNVYEILAIIYYDKEIISNVIPDDTEITIQNGNSSANIQNGGVLAGQGDVIYYAHGGTIYSQNINSNENKVVLSAEDEYGISDINIIGDYLCFLLRPAGKSVHCMGSYSGLLEIYNLNTDRYEFIPPEPSQNFPVVYNGELYYLQRNGKYATEYISEMYGLYNLCKFDFESKTTSIIKEDVYTLTLNDDELIYGRIDKLIPAASDTVDISYYDMNDKLINASGRMAWFAEMNSTMGYLSSNYTLTDYKNFTYESKNGAYVRTDENGIENKLSSINPESFNNAHSPFGSLNYVYLNADIVFYVNDSGDICQGDYNTGVETILISNSEYSNIGRLQIYNNTLYGVIDGTLCNIKEL